MEKHTHHHDEEEGGSRLLKIGIAAILLVAAVLIEKNTAWERWQYLLLFLVPYLVVGWDTLKEAAEGILHADDLGPRLKTVLLKRPEIVFPRLFQRDIGQIFKSHSNHLSL